MNWKLFTGQMLDRFEKALLSLNLSFVSRNYPYRRNWTFDLKRQLPQPKVIFDVGAYVGDLSTELNKRFPDAKIYAFEPVNTSFDKLRHNTLSINNIIANNIALGEREETIEIPLFSESSVNTLKTAAYDHPAASSQIVKVARLDNFMNQYGIEKIDILKIDVEGYELEVLKGAGDMLAKVDCIVAEVGYRRCDTKTHFTDVELYMESNGFQLFNIYQLMPYYSDKTRLFYSDNVYFNKRLIKNPVT